MKTTTVQEMAKDLTEFHTYKVVPFNKTTMTIPAILYYAISVTHESPNKYFDELATNVKNEILKQGVSPSELTGKLSKKVQEIAWKEVIFSRPMKDEVKLTSFTRSKVIPYAGTTMTIPMVLFELFLAEIGDKRATSRYIKDRATVLKDEILAANNATKEDLKGRVSQKIQENLWLELIPKNVITYPIELVA